MIIVVGAKGNMGRRYCQILDEFKIKHKDYDIDSNIRLGAIKKKIDGIIIATPTNTHYSIYRMIRKTYSGKILCEKPFSVIPEQCLPVQNDTNLYIVNNYQYAEGLSESKKIGNLTNYSYYNSGKDGLHIDCIQLYYLAEGDVSLTNKSSVWVCQINGKNIDRSLIDVSYRMMISDFCENDLIDIYSHEHYYNSHIEAIGQQRLLDDKN